MAIKRYTLGDGTLTLGGVGGPGDIAAQVTAMRVTWSEQTDSTDAIPVLSGEEVAAENTSSYSAQLVGNLIQDLDADGLVEWSWANKGTAVAVTFVPNTAKGRAVTGTVTVAPIDLGGDVKDKAPRSDISWAFVGDPVLGAAV